MGRKQAEVFICDECGHATLEIDELYKCIHCGNDVCPNINCGYTINVTVRHDIPNGIPYLNTQARYRICKKCHVLNQSPCKELYELLTPEKNSKFYIHGIRGDWVRREID